LICTEVFLWLTHQKLDLNMKIFGATFGIGEGNWPHRSPLSTRMVSGNIKKL